MSTRRHALKLMLATAATSALAPRVYGEDTIALRPGIQPPAHIPEDFIGLGYEMSSVARLGLLDGSNQAYVALVRGLGAKGILRVGGIVADYTRFDPQGQSAFDPKNTILTQENLYQFAAFLKKTDWRTIWSLNFAQGSLEEAIAEARAVDATLGHSLAAFELGNEVENYSNGSHPFRTNWDYAAYRSQYREWTSAIRKVLPHASFAAPDTAASIEWVESMAQDANGDVELLTTHYYRNHQSRGSADQLLTADPALPAKLQRLRAASEHSRIPWRMCETNSFSGGGLPGVSDTIVGALWTLDFLLLLAASGCAGVNIETGYNQLGFLSSYSPIRNDQHSVAYAGPTYYGMLAFAEARKYANEVRAVAVDSSLNLNAYALSDSGKPRSVVLINRERTQEAVIDLRAIQKDNAATYRLIADTNGITYGAAQVEDTGHWTPALKEKVQGGKVRIPAQSAAVISTSREI